MISSILVILFESFTHTQAPPTHPTTEMPHKTRIPPQTGVDRWPIAPACRIPPMQSHSKGLSKGWTRGPVQSGAIDMGNAWLSPTWRARLLPKKSVVGTNYDLLTLRLARGSPAPPFKPSLLTSFSSSLPSLLSSALCFEGLRSIMSGISF